MTARGEVRTEGLLTSPEAFRIITASPAQRAMCRILDGECLGELASHPDVLDLVGGAEARAQLPSERGIAPVEVVVLAAIRTAKTIIACAAALRMTQTVNVSRLGPGEIPRVSLLNLTLNQATVAHRLLVETVRASKVLSPLLIEDTADSMLIRHPSGRPIEVSIVPGSKSGSSMISRWSAGCVVDESPRWGAFGDAVVNLRDVRSAVLGRLLPGAQLLMIGSPHAPFGEIYDLVQSHWQKPTDHLVVLRGTGPALNPVYWTPGRCAKLEAQDPSAYLTDVLGDFCDPESGLLNPLAIYRSTRERPLELPYEYGATYHAAVDPSEGSAKGNGFTLCIVERQEPERQTRRYGQDADDSPRFRVALVREWRGFSPAECWKQIAAVCRTYGLRRVRSDQYAASANADLARMYGLALHIDRASESSKLEDYTNLQTLLHNDKLDLSPDALLKRDLLSVKRRVTQGAATIVLPRAGGRHCDSASALCAAIKDATVAVAPTYFHVPGM